MDHGSDALRTLFWGLRRYVWLVLLCIAAVGVGIPVALTRGPDVYEAKALCAPSQLELTNLDGLPRFGYSTFSNGAVAEAVRTYLQLPPSAPVVPERVDLIAEQDNPALIVVGRSDDMETAAEIANVAASILVGELNKSSQAIATYVIQRQAEPPVEPVAKLDGSRTFAIAIIAGALAGVGAVALLLVWRRPILNGESAKSITGIPVLGTVHFRRSSRSHPADDVAGLMPLCRRLLREPYEMLMLVSTQQASRERHQLASGIATVLAPLASAPAVDAADASPTTLFAPKVPIARQGGVSSGAIEPVFSQPHSDHLAGRERIVVVDGPTPEELMRRSDASLTLLVIPQGISVSKLRLVADEFLGSADAGIVFISGRGWHRNIAAGRPHLKTSTTPTEIPSVGTARTRRDTASSGAASD